MYAVLRRPNLGSRPTLPSIVGNNLTWIRTRRLPFGATLLDGLAGGGLVFGNSSHPKGPRLWFQQKQSSSLIGILLITFKPYQLLLS